MPVPALGTLLPTLTWPSAGGDTVLPLSALASIPKHPKPLKSKAALKWGRQCLSAHKPGSTRLCGKPGHTKLLVSLVAPKALLGLVAPVPAAF